MLLAVFSPIVAGSNIGVRDTAIPARSKKISIAY